MLERFNTIGIKLVTTVGAALVLILSSGFLFLLERRYRLELESLVHELSTITSYAEAVREYMAGDLGNLLPDSRVYRDRHTVPIIVAWQTAQRYSEGKGYGFRTPSLNPRNPENLPDVFERRALEAFSREPALREFYEETEAEGRRVFRFAAPVRVSKDCLQCHGGPRGLPDGFGYPREGLKAGDLKGAFSVTASLVAFDTRMRENGWVLLGVGVTTICLITLILLLIVRQITTPLHELVSATRKMGEGDLGEAVAVRSGDEVGQLARSFNEMASKLRASHDTLEEKVEARTAELRRSQAQLLQAAKLASIGELVGGIAHEINNPTGVIAMRSATLMEDARALGLSSDIQEDIEVIQRQSQRLATITSGLLQFSRHSPFSPSAVEINGLVSRPISFVEPTLRNRGIACRLDLAEDLPYVWADTTRIEQVLLNLYTNAIDAMTAGGELTVRTRHTKLPGDGKPSPPVRDSASGGGGWVVVCVRDTGVGIQSENLTRIFDPFFTTKEVGKGTGLGLAISYGIVQEHGGQIEVESRWGQGAEFRVYLPAAKDQQPGTRDEV